MTTEASAMAYKELVARVKAEQQRSLTQTVEDGVKRLEACADNLNRWKTMHSRCGLYCVCVYECVRVCVCVCVCVCVSCDEFRYCSSLDFSVSIPREEVEEDYRAWQERWIEFFQFLLSIGCRHAYLTNIAHDETLPL